MIFPIERNRETIQVQLAFSETCAKFDFNCKYIENARILRLLIRTVVCQYNLYMYFNCGLSTGSGCNNLMPIMYFDCFCLKFSILLQVSQWFFEIKGSRSRISFSPAVPTFMYSLQRFVQSDA